MKLLWTVAADGCVATGDTPTQALARLRAVLPEYPVDKPKAIVHTKNQPTKGRPKVATKTVKETTSDLSGKVIAKREDAVKVAITFPETRKRFELDAAADEVLNLIEKATEVTVRGRKPGENGKKK